MQKLNLKNALTILLFLSLSACSNLQIPNEPICADISSTTGYCVKTVSGEAFEVTGNDWIVFNKKALKMSPESYGKIKALILKLCKKDKTCNIQQVEQHMNQVEQLLN